MNQKRKQSAPRTYDVHRTLPTNTKRPPIYRSASGRHTQPPTTAVEPPETAKKPKPERNLWRTLCRILLLLVIGIFTLAIIFIAWDSRNISAFSKKLFGSSNLVALARGGSLKSDNGRVNVLIVGYSADDPGHQGADLTDSLLLLSMSTTNHTGYLLSIPRDLYIQMPDGSYSKINAAFQTGGIDLLKHLVATNFALQVNYYTLIDYGAVRNIVNALGGIDVTINSPDGKLYDPNTDWDTGGPLVNLTNGTHHLNGEQALDLTRARGDPTPNGQPIGFGFSDFQRTADQRLVFTAIKARLNWKLVLNPRKNNEILNAVASNIATDVQVGEARPLFALFNNIPANKLQSVSLNNFNGQDLLQSYESYYAGDTLIPAAGIDDYSQIDQALHQLNQK